MGGLCPEPGPRQDVGKVQPHKSPHLHFAMLLWWEVTLILQVRLPRPREVGRLAQGHTQLQGVPPTQVDHWRLRQAPSPPQVPALPHVE